MTNHDKLCELLRPMRTHDMTTHEVVVSCREGVPGCTNDEIIAALQQVGQEHMRESGLLMREARCRKAGITGVHHGGGKCL